MTHWSHDETRRLDQSAFALVAILTILIATLISPNFVSGQEPKPAGNTPIKDSPDKATAVFGGGCFWCMEAVFERVWGVDAVVSGYSGGNLPNPSYQQVLTDTTGHAEVIRIEYNPAVVSYTDLLKIFFKSHDPTSLNAQGPDHGTRYRSVIFYKTEDEKEQVEALLDEFKKKKTFRGKIVTEVSPLRNFYDAEEYHQDYFEKHPDQPYCEMNIRPKIGKFEKGFKENSKLQKTKEEKLQQSKPNRPSPGKAGTSNGDKP